MSTTKAMLPETLVGMVGWYQRVVLMALLVLYVGSWIFHLVCRKAPAAGFVTVHMLSDYKQARQQCDLAKVGPEATPEVIVGLLYTWRTTTKDDMGAGVICQPVLNQSSVRDEN
jgi:hypothetical protein